MFKRIQIFLGPDRLRNLFLLLAFTGLGNLILNAAVNEVDWAQDAQTALVIIWIVGTVWIILSAMDAFTRGRWIGILAPAAGAVILGLLFPTIRALMLGLAIGWILAGALIFRPRGPEEYRTAIKHLRKGEYKEAVEAMSDLIKQEPKVPGHYRFRAELLRLWGKLDRARRDYKTMTDLAPDLAIAWNGLAEVELQAGNYDKAQTAGIKALELAPDEWVAGYNLGMIEDRLGESQAALDHLQAALDATVPDKRHRLLIHLYQARAYARLGQFEAARQAVDHMRRYQNNLSEWHTLLESDQAETLRQVIAEDIATAEALLDDAIAVEALAES
jgi:tetratricopeptide (TPR) repeat protein